MHATDINWENYPHLHKYSAPLKPMTRRLIGRDSLIRSIMAAFSRAELCNVILLAPAGCGKTALVQGTMERDADRLYLEVDLARMIADCQNDTNEMAAKLKLLFSETEKCVRNEGQEIVLFIDEFHQVVQLSAAAVEALKPLLADSGTRGIRVIAATTLEEFNQFIAPNQPLVERLQRINVPEPDEDATVEILKNMAKTYGVDNLFFDDHVFHMIYEYTNRYIPANSQPRKSIKVLDAMVGWNRSENRKMDDRLLADVIQESEDVNVAFRVDASTIKKRLDERVLAQQYATSQIERRLQLCVADLNDKSKPMSTFLFTGSTGVGKSCLSDSLLPVIKEDGFAGYVKAGDVEVGDYLFDREGKPTRVLGVFPQGKREVYRVTFGDGRTADVSDNHLWAVYPAKRPRQDGPTIYSTKSLISRGLETRHQDRVGMKYFIPMNGAAQWPERDLPVDPYVMGAFIGNGSLSANTALVLSSIDEVMVKRIADKIGAAGYAPSRGNCDWVFYHEMPTETSRGVRIQQFALFGDFDEVYHVKSPERRIPDMYMTASVEQRWELVRGLFDTDGHIGQRDGGRYNVSYSTASEWLAKDVQLLLYSLGVSTSIHRWERTRENGTVSVEYDLHVMSRNEDKARFFWLPRKHDIAMKAHGVNKQREKTFDFVGIRSIEDMGYKSEMVCFYVDNDEHLFQAENHVVTHNTEMTKQLAEILFQDQRRLLRFDMTEYANDESLERFRDLLTTRIWEHPYSIVLLDEIEKACSSVTRLLLQVLDDGRLTNRNNREVSFTNCYIVLTTNAGSEIYKTIAQYGESNSEKDMAIIAKKYDKLIRRSLSETSGDNRFPPELIGRIDVMVPFQPLSRETMGNIVMMKLRKLKAQVKARHGVQLVIDKDVVRYLVEDNLSTDSDSGGARIVMSKLETEVTTNVARYINEHPFASRIAVKVDGDMAIDNKRQLESKASIKVLAC